MRLACSTASFPQDRIEIATAKVAWAGYQGVELVLPDEPLPDEDRMRARLRADELELAAVFAGATPVGTGPAALDELARIGRAAALARALDGALLVLEAPAEGDVPSFVAAIKLLDRALGDYAADLCLVNRPGTLLDLREALVEFWRQDLPERIGLALDPAAAVQAGWDPLVLDALPLPPRHVYLNDVREGKIVPPGDGDLDLAELGRMLEKREYGGSICLRIENADPWMVEPLAKEIREQAIVWFG